MKRLFLISFVFVFAACRVLGSSPRSNYQPPDEIKDTRDAVVTYVRDHYPDAALPADLQWAGANTTPRNLVGSMSYEFTSGDWQVTIDHGIVAPEEVTYHVVIQNTDSGFDWAGTVNAQNEVIDGKGSSEPGFADAGFLVEGADFTGFVFKAQWAESQEFYHAVGESFWTPSQTDILALEGGVTAAIKPYAEMEGYPDMEQRLPDYLRQYVGLIVEGRRLIYVALFCNSLGFDWQKELILWNLMDGGICNIDLSFDPATGEFPWIYIHGES